MRITNLLLIPVAAVALGASAARGEMIELVNGKILQGDVVQSQTTDEGLAVNVYDTGGTVIVRWDHIVPSRRKQFRLEGGLDLPEETVELIDGHRVLLNSGEYLVGWAENPREISAPLRMKTRTGTKEYPREMLAGKVEDVKIDGLIVYSVEDLYQKMRSENPPETAYAHKALAQRCMNIDAFEHAKEHLTAAKADAAFMETAEGHAVDAMLRQADLMIRAKGASDLVQQIKLAQNAQKWNDALKLLNQIDAEYKDEQIRNAIRFDLLEARVVKGRDTYFQRAIALDVYKVLESLCEKKAREQKPLRQDTATPPGAAGQGTLAAARQWANRELDAQLWEKVAADLGLNKEEIEKYWPNRSVKNVRRVNYGTGSFIVVKKPTTAGKPNAEPPRRRTPSGSDRDRGGKNVPDKPSQVEKKLTEEQWWEKVSGNDKRNWLIAYFVETSGRFQILRADETNCESCGGTGKITSTGTDGSSSDTFCKTCNEGARFRSVSYR